MVFGSLTCHHITLTRVCLIQNDPPKKPADFCTRPRAIHWLSWPKPRFISRPKIKQSVVRFSVWYSHISSPSLSLFHALSTLPVSSHTHASIGSLEQEDFHHICIYKKKTKKNNNLKISSKILSFWEKDPPHPDPENNQLRTSPTFFSSPSQYIRDGRMAGKKGGKREKKEKETAPAQSSQSAGYMTLICNREVVCRMFALYISACIEVLNCAMLSIAERRMQFNM